MSVNLRKDNAPKPEKARFSFEIRETYVRNVTIEANSFDEARKRISHEFPVGMCAFTRDNFDGAEFLWCCSECGSTFSEDEIDYLTELDSGTPQARVLCDRCTDDWVRWGDLVRCADCGMAFDPKRKRINPATGYSELCPICGAFLDERSVEK